MKKMKESIENKIAKKTRYYWNRYIRTGLTAEQIIEEAIRYGVKIGKKSAGKA